MPEVSEFGEDSPMNYGLVKYQNANGDWIEKQIKHLLAIMVAITMLLMKLLLMVLKN